MKRVFIDTNIVIDLLQKREGFYIEAQELFTLGDNGDIRLYLSALTIANTHYILLKHYKPDEAKKILATFKVLVSVLPIDDKIIELALASDFKDFEDAIQYFTAMEHQIDVIITRNKKDFKGSSISLLTAKEYLHR
ncbi:type II toxin-antitoxin system VapC family toxin [Niabella drilacis]|uniref:Predicted nucleic acid-binding protein, contains PIN domain n=1 Tax=Niabella drilacis (strain DSM 25811 / CCM 8410 / CCUG 62505 / LMG 26954 / E90) TaxID=1285928 RepID=A0A1G7BR00_NIADE|nr:PIN domain-containing protein [Niabella drilacis]SDE29423.1 Predicted nucleic acid-binding protein, contains PIN domain [Niabella drilacis]